MSHSAPVEKAFSICEGDPSKVLGLRLTNGTEVKPGDYVPRKDLTSCPEFSWNGPAGKYMLIKLDLDAPFPSFPFASPISHHIRSHFTLGDGGKLVEDDQINAIAPWAPPGPPPGSAPHRYVFMLFPQHEQFRAESEMPGGQSWSMWKCVRFDLPAFLQRTGLPAEPVAATYLKSN